MNVWAYVPQRNYGIKINLYFARMTPFTLDSSNVVLSQFQSVMLAMSQFENVGSPDRDTDDWPYYSDADEFACGNSCWDLVTPHPESGMTKVPAFASRLNLPRTV